VKNATKEAVVQWNITEHRSDDKYNKLVKSYEEIDNKKGF